MNEGPIYLELMQPGSKGPCLMNMTFNIRVSCVDKGKAVHFHQQGSGRKHFTVPYLYMRDVILKHERLHYVEVANMCNQMPLLINVKHISRVSQARHDLHNKNGEYVRTIEATLIEMSGVTNIVSDSLYADVKKYLQEGTPLPCSPLTRLREM